MARSSKWIEATGDDDVRVVACRALDLRLRRVWHYLELAIEEPPAQIENVHQLRVAARRAEAALDTFEPWLPRRRGRWIGKQAKRVRRAAGAARDFDVLLERWRERPPLAEPEPARLVCHEIERHRHAAQRPIAKAYARLADKHFNHKAARLLARIADHQEQGYQRFGSFARQTMEPLAIDYLKAAEAELTQPESLHAFRIQGKKVRYAMEIFAGAFDEDLRKQLYPLVESLQERLGAINDHVSACDYFSEWQDHNQSAETAAALAAAVEVERAAVEQGTREFLDWWTSELRDQLRSGFAPYVPHSET